MLLTGPVGISKSSGSGVMSVGGSTGEFDLLRESSYKGNYYPQEAAPVTDVTNRKVVTDSNFSLLVKDVTETIGKIKEQTTALSGYMVTANINSAEYGNTASIQVRVPIEKVEDFIKYLRGLAVKVVSENVNGHDVTDQYVDIERRLGDLESQRLKMQAILDKATTVEEMMEVQRAIFSVQDQIDSYKGQLLYLDGTTKTSKVTIYLATDELELPYTPDNPWRPEVVFKKAVRSMIGNLQKVGSAGIWLAVYLPLVAILIILVIGIRKLLSRKKGTTL